MLVLSTILDYEKLYKQWHGKRVVLVPTMGALHEGHQALIRQARQLADVVVVSIFVNPLQFGPKEDLAAYPRPLEQDLEICRGLKVDAVFHPAADEMYPAGMAQVTTVIPPASLTERYCGAARPGHFVGVATVVLKLFNIIKPQIAILGEKDAQQLAVIRKMVADLHLPVEIIGYPTVRAENGLALSSRNQYFKTDAEKQAALILSRILNRVQEWLSANGQGLPAEETLAKVSESILKEWQEPSVTVQLQYLAAVNKDTFEPVNTITKGTRLLIAAYVNQVRLIDNLELR